MKESNDGEANNITYVQENLHGHDNDKQARKWLNLCMLGVASTSAATSALLQLTCAGIALHTTQVPSTPIARANIRRAVILNITQSERRCRDLLRLSPAAFESLMNELKTKSKVKNFNRGSIEGHLLIFLIILGHNFKNRVISFFLCRSGETISRYFYNILVSVITPEDAYVKPVIGDEVPSIIFNSHRFFQFFKDCLAAIDGTYVRVKVSQIDAHRYRSKKEWPTQNVLVACTFDLKFTYILAGWEGSAADSRILQNALTKDEPLVIPEGKFYLGDASFGLTSKQLTPYGSTRYHLKEYSQRAPETPEELFNHRHSSIRNAIERAFGVLKKRFPIIASGSECHYSCATMTHIILACCVLHNFMPTFDNDEVNCPTEEGLFADERHDNEQLDS